MKDPIGQHTSGLTGISLMRHSGACSRIIDIWRNSVFMNIGPFPDTRPVGGALAFRDGAVRACPPRPCSRRQAEGSMPGPGWVRRCELDWLPCQGHVTQSASSVPSESGPPRWLQRSARANRPSSFVATITRTPSTVRATRFSVGTLPRTAVHSSGPLSKALVSTPTPNE